jgi:thiamine-monophosphate kinase
MDGEFDLIRRYFRPLASHPGALGLADDAALIDPEPGTQIVVTSDTIVENIHFLQNDPPESVAHKLLGVNFSDIAAMGAEPLGYVLSLALPQSWAESQREAWLSGFAVGLSDMQIEVSAGLLGGDTVSSPGGLVLTVTAFGRVPSGRALQRSGARPGDIVFLTGTLGDAALGLAALQDRLTGLPEAVRTELVRRYRHPSPRIGVGPRLVGLASAAIDVSDGLVADLGHLCRASNVTAAVDANALPLSAAAQTALTAQPDLLPLILTGGDDYELAFTAPAQAHTALAAVTSASGVAITAIGEIEAALERADDPPVRVMRGRDPVILGAGGFQHFA